MIFIAQVNCSATWLVFYFGKDAKIKHASRNFEIAFSAVFKIVIRKTCANEKHLKSESNIKRVWKTAKNFGL